MKLFEHFLEHTIFPGIIPLGDYPKRGKVLFKGGDCFLNIISEVNTCSSFGNTKSVSFIAKKNKKEREREKERAMRRKRA